MEWSCPYPEELTSWRKESGVWKSGCDLGPKDTVSLKTEPVPPPGAQGPPWGRDDNVTNTSPGHSQSLSQGSGISQVGTRKWQTHGRLQGKTAVCRVQGFPEQGAVMLGWRWESRLRGPLSRSTVLKRGPTGPRKAVRISLGRTRFFVSGPRNHARWRRWGPRGEGTWGRCPEVQPKWKPTQTARATGKRWQVTGGWAGGRDLTWTESPGGTARRGPRGGDHALTGGPRLGGTVYSGKSAGASRVLSLATPTRVSWSLLMDTASVKTAAALTPVEDDFHFCSTDAVLGSVPGSYWGHLGWAYECVFIYAHACRNPSSCNLTFIPHFSRWLINDLWDKRGSIPWLAKVINF
jgi:hypothetical protein